MLVIDASDLLKSGSGAVIGFILAQFVNISRSICQALFGVRLKIETKNGAIISAHAVEIPDKGVEHEFFFGFLVRNTGLRIAADVRFQVLKIEKRKPGYRHFEEISDHALGLSLYREGRGDKKDRAEFLLPQAAVLVHLASWREDLGIAIPALDGTREYRELMRSGDVEYRFMIAAYDAHGRYASAILTIPCGPSVFSSILLSPFSPQSE